MTNVQLKANPSILLNNNFENLVNAFALYYGEDKIDEIRNTFSNCMLIGYLIPDELGSIISEDKKRISKVLLDTILNKYSEYKLPDDLLSELSSFNYEYFSNFKISKMGEFFELNKVPKEERVSENLEDRYNFAKRFIPDLDYDTFRNNSVPEELKNRVPEFFRYTFDLDTLDQKYEKKYDEILSYAKQIFPEVTDDNFIEYLNQGKFDFLEKISIEIEEVKKEFDNYVNDNLKEIIDLNEYLKDIQNDLFKKYYCNYIDEFKDLLSEEDLNKFEENKQNKYLSLTTISGVEVFFSSNFRLNSIIDYFNKISDDRLNDPNTNSYTINDIKEKRIKYFKYKGIDLGDNYDDYMNDPRIKEIWPSEEFINRLKDRKNYYYNKFNLEYYSSIPFYKETLEKINNLNLLDKNISFNQKMYAEKVTCINPNIRLTENGFELFTLLLFDAGSLNDYFDVRLIHELNHLYELSLLNVDTNNNKYEMICGWDYLNGDINQTSIAEVDTVTKDENKRKYERFSEIINELIAQDITQNMHNNGIYIGSDKENAKIKGGTGYERTIDLVRDFFNTYKKEIIESRKNNNIQIIFDTVGKENFDRLNDLFEKMKPVLGNNYLTMRMDLKNGKMTDDVKYFLSIIEERNQILSDMQEYSNKKVM